MLENALRVMWLMPEGSGTALASQRLLASTSASPADPSGDPFGRYIAPAFSLQGIFPDPWCAPLGPLTPNLGQKRGREQLAGDISRSGSKKGSPITDMTEVAKMKRNP